MYKCTNCTYKSSNLEMFTSHLKIHSKTLHYKCSECKITFETQAGIEAHVKIVHNAPEIYYDNHQLEKYIESNACNSDQNYTDKVSNYNCKKCLMTFEDKNNLATHICNENTLKYEPGSIDISEKSLVIKNLEASKNEKGRCIYRNSTQKNDVLNSKSDLSKYIEQNVNIESRDLGKSLNRCDTAHCSAPVDFTPICGQDIHTNNIFNLLNVKTVSDMPMNTVNYKQAIDFSSRTDDNADICRNTSVDVSNLEQEVEVEKYSENIHSNNTPDTNSKMNVLDTVNTNECLVSHHNSLNLNLSVLPTDESSSHKEQHNCSTEDQVYICPICGIKSSSQTRMTSHFKCHIDRKKKRYTCHICNRILTTHSNLKRHLINHEKCKSGQVDCQYCNESLVDRIHYKQHIEEQHQESYKCMYCEKTFPNKKLCKEHEFSHPERATFKCDACGQMFITEGRLKNHKEFIHNDVSKLFSENKIFKCHICFKTLTTYHNLKRHIRNHEKFSGTVSCNICSEELSDKIHLRQHIEDKHPENYQCSYCNKIFTSLPSCKNHELSHPERLIHKCDSCDKMFPSELRLERHKTLLHRDPICRICGKEILNRSKLIEHEKRHERHKQQFTCKECPKVFRTPAGLKYHMSVHTGKYAVYCEICGKGLHSEVVLEEHKATHTKEVRYMCELCGRKFSSNSTYRMHRLWHDNPLPYQCNICERKFKHTSILAVHKRRAHTGERPYKCKVCSLTFSVSSTLNKHMILHTKQYPYKCEHCSKGFTTRTKISRHLAKVHNDYSMLNSQKKACEYKMVLRPSEMSEVQNEIIQDTDEKDSDIGVLQQVVVEIDPDLYDILEQQPQTESQNAKK